MGCILACFRPRCYSGRRRDFADANSGCSKITEQSTPAKQLASLLLCEGNGSPRRGDPVQDSTANDSDSEAKFLISCGAILETPAEFHKGHKMASLQTDEEESTLSEASPQLNASLTVPMHDEPTNQLEEHTNRTPLPLSVNDEEGFCIRELGRCEPAESPTSCRTSNLLSLLMPEPQTTHVYRNAKAAGYEDATAYSTTESIKESDCRDISTPEIIPLGLKQSPSPTPLNLTDELQTPGTIFSRCGEKFAFTRDGIRSEYIYPETKPFIDTSQWKVCGEETPLTSGLTMTSEPLYSLTPGIPEKESDFGAPLTSHQQAKTPASPLSLVQLPGVSQWQKPNPETTETMSKEVVATTKSNCSNNTDQDRPIIGGVAAYWREDEILQVSPKQWNGNGVPNSTSKYKEDQKVSWHATPFERRLEKALTDENLVPKVALQEF